MDSFCDSDEPAIVIASSGMMMPDTASAKWAEEFLWRENKSISTVNYQNPKSPGYAVANSKPGQYLPINGKLVKRQCEVKSFDLSAHMDMIEGRELEERMNAGTVIYVHGENQTIEDALAANSNGHRRIKAEVGKEIRL
jgi:Cft2 family RNA processing exonuclease